MKGAFVTLVALVCFSTPVFAQDSKALHLRQLVGLIGTWQFSLDMSPTVSWDSPILKSYRIMDVEEDFTLPVASGVHQEDESRFVIWVQPRDINNQEHTFYMRDKDMEEEGNPTCLTYRFNQAGPHLLGYFQMHKAGSGECTDDLVAVGILTGRRHQGRPHAQAGR